MTKPHAGSFCHINSTFWISSVCHIRGGKEGNCSPLLIHCHLPSFSYRHGMIPKLYVMPWKQDMKYRDMALKHAKLVELYSGPLEDSLFLEKRERHCHGEDRKQLLQKVPCQLTVEDIPIYSHLSRYHKSMVAYGFRIRL
uniref:Sperm microtubule inner protein 10 n=1 Tax=Podarcis muralis TaxID=64176 RepID=A0A670JJV7_PODMU